MLHTIMFTKVSGAWNDFVLIDNMKGELDVDKSRLAVVLCSRNFGVGADGLIVLEPSRNSSFFMLNYNADGSHGGMSGNGGRCAARYAFLNGIAGITMRFESLSHMYEADVIGANVRLKMKEPAHQRFDLTVDVCGQSFICHCIDTGSPHVVIFDPDAESRDVQGVGRAVREHRMFAPKGRT